MSSTRNSFCICANISILIVASVVCRYEKPRAALSTTPPDVDMYVANSYVEAAAASFSCGLGLPCYSLYALRFKQKEKRAAAMILN